MPQRPTSLVGLTVHYAKTKWAGLGRPARIAVLAALVIGSLSVLSVGRYMVRGAMCPSGGCPYSAGAGDSPCGG